MVSSPLRNRLDCIGHVAVTLSLWAFLLGSEYLLQRTNHFLPLEQTKRETQAQHKQVVNKKSALIWGCF